jgi:hypothetical protein
MARQPIRVKSIMFLALGSALVWLPLISQLADASHLGGPAPAPDPVLLATTVLANAGLAGLILLNLWLNLRRRK